MVALLVLAATTAFCQVFVTNMPDGGKEITGVSKTGAHVLRLDGNGALQSWIDDCGNVDITKLTNWEQPGTLGVFAGNTLVVPTAKSTLSINASSPQEVQAIVTGEDGTRLIYVMQPGRLGLRVEGDKTNYVVLGRTPAGGESARLAVAGKTYFPSTGARTLEGAPQILTDALRTRALAFTCPAPMTWTLAQNSAWLDVKEHLQWRTALPAGQTLWLSAADVPAFDGATQFGLYYRRYFRPEGSVQAIATLSSTRLSSESPVTLTLSQPIANLDKDGVLLAALLPLTPDDPVAASEQVPFYLSTDTYSDRMQPLDVKANGGEWIVMSTPATPPGVYRMRVWVVPRSLPLPAVLGGPRGATVGYFPGFEMRGASGDVRQNFPIGDELVTVGVPSSGSLTVVDPEARGNFWRGERIRLMVQARAPQNQVVASLEMRCVATGQVVATQRVEVTLTGGFGVSEYTLDTSTLAPGEYSVRAAAPGLASYPYSFFVAPPRASGMPLIQSPIATSLVPESLTRLGISASARTMTSGTGPAWPEQNPLIDGLSALDSALPAYTLPATDPLVRDNWFFLQGIQSRQISFGLHTTIPEQVDETYRKHLIFAQFNRGLPSTLGLIFDYDVSGMRGYYGYNAAYTASWKQRLQLIDAKWQEYWAKAKAAGATDAEMTRYQGLFSSQYFADFYAKSIADLHTYVPEQRHTSAVTPDHNSIENGQFPPRVYQPLDFRYLEVWNDQVYPNSAEDMQASFWTSLLRPQKPGGQPIWITVPTAPQPGTHLRRSLDSIARGAAGIGYGSEGAAGLEGGWGADPAHSDIRAAQESLSGEMAKKYGTWLNAFRPDEQVALLYSLSQGGTVFGSQSPLFSAYYTLAQLNRPARLVTEEGIENGALKNVGALILVGQTKPLPESVLKKIEAFAAAGGRVILDKDTTLDIKGATKLAVGWGTTGPNRGNKFNEALHTMAETMRGPLLNALGDLGRQPLEPQETVPFASLDKTFQVAPVLVATKRAGANQIVFVTANQPFPLASWFDESARGGSFFRMFSNLGDVFFKDVRVPRLVNLTLRGDLAAKPPKIYDVFAGREVPIRRVGNQAVITVDLSSLPGRVLLLSDAPVAAPQLYLKKRSDASPLATLGVKSAVPLPVEITVGSQTIYRTADASTTWQTFALSPRLGKIGVEVTELATGQTRHASLNLAQPPKASLQAAPPVQAVETARIREILRTPHLALYVDARQADALGEAKVLSQGLQAQTVFNPPILPYVTGWSHTPEIEAANQAILKQSELGWRVADDPYLQWTGAMQPAAVWNRPVILFGNVNNNKLIADLNSVTLLARPARPELIGPGHAWIQPIASPFWYGANAVVVLCADAAGRRAAFAELMKIRDGKASGEALLADAPRAERLSLLGFANSNTPPQNAPTGVLPSTLAQSMVGLQPVIPISGLALTQGGVLATLHSPGENFVRLSADLKAQWRVPTAGFYQPNGILANAAGEAVTYDERFTWRHDADGKLLWKALGKPLTAPDSKGDIWLREGNDLQQVSATSEVLHKLALTDTILAAAADGHFVLVKRPGTAQNRTQATSTLVALSLPDGKELWSAPDTDAAQVVVSAGDKTVALIENENLGNRDDLSGAGATRLSLLDAATGKVLWSHPYGQSLSHLAMSADGSRIVAEGDGFCNWFLVADAQSGELRRVDLPQSGIWARSLSDDGKTFWAATEKLYRVDLDTLNVTPVYSGRLLQLLAAKNGVWAGTPDGCVLKLDASGHVLQKTDLLPDLAMQDALAQTQSLRAAKLIPDPTLAPKEVGERFLMQPEVPWYWFRQGDYTTFGDGTIPLDFSVRIAHKGHYRIVLEPAVEKKDAGTIGSLMVRVLPDATQVRTAPENGDALRQVATFELEPGIHKVLISLIFDGSWKAPATLRYVTVEEVDRQQ
jgi:outer membrane protein assembly factor BamB